MKKHRVRVPRNVQEQIDAQIEYIERHSLHNALAWEERLRAAILGIGPVAGAHPIDKDASERLGYAVHKVVFERTYLIHYRIDKKARLAVIVNFRHGARLPGPDEP